jgi:hypothetical protein
LRAQHQPTLRSSGLTPGPTRCGIGAELQMLRASLKLHHFRCRASPLGLAGIRMPAFQTNLPQAKQWLKRPSMLGFTKLKAENVKKEEKDAEIFAC